MEDEQTAPATKSFNFITITNPVQAKDKKNKRSVRSHVMFDYAASKRKGRNSALQNDGTVLKSTKVRARRRRNESDGLNGLGELFFDDPVVIEGLATVRKIAESSIARKKEGSEDSAKPAAPNMQELSRYYRALMLLKKHGASLDQPQKMLIQDDETFELVWNSGFAKQYTIRALGDGVDPFYVLPHFRDSTIYMAKMKMWCLRRFGTKAMSVNWVPALASSRLTYLAALCVAANDIDVCSGIRGESALTVTVKTEVIEMVNERLADPVTQQDDAILMAIQLLLCGEIVSGNEWIWGIHEDGTTKIILQRGGLHTLGISGDLAAVVYGVISLVNVLRETQPHEIYKQYVPLQMSAMSPDRAVPESPLLCPRCDFYTIVRSKSCTEAMYDLLCDVRDLTDIFLARDMEILGSQEQGDSDWIASGSICKLAALREAHGPLKTTGDMQEAARKILTRVQQIPEFNAAEDAPSYAGWMFEACRIAALIHATAIVEHLPFSQAANLIDQQWKARSNPGEGVFRGCVHKLRDAVDNSNVSQCWNDMVGVLFWVSLIGGAAARAEGKTDEWKEDDEWSRKYLTSTVMRVCVLICFEHGRAMMVTLRRLSKIQELLGKLPPSHREVDRVLDI